MAACCVTVVTVVVVVITARGAGIDCMPDDHAWPGAAAFPSWYAPTSCSWRTGSVARHEGCGCVAAGAGCGIALTKRIASCPYEVIDTFKDRAAGSKALKGFLDRVPAGCRAGGCPRRWRRPATT